jgi:hypothetical protein
LREGATLPTAAGGGAISNLTVVATSNTQAMLSYTAPDSNPCTVEVSESASYSPLVNDVNATLFAGSDSDNRDGNLVSGTSRIVMLGRRLVRTASDGNRYSLALQTNTPHYVRLTCGTATDTATFTTKNIPGGSTYGEIPEADPARPGQWLTPTQLTDSGRNTQRVVDNFTGALMKPVTLRSDRAGNPNPHAMNTGFGGFVRACTAGQQTTSDGHTGFVCQIFNEGPELTNLYFIEPSTGMVRNLGHLAPAHGHITMDPNMCFIGTGYGPAYRFCYVGDWQEHFEAAMDGGVLHSSVSIQTQLAAFDASYDPTYFPCGNMPYANAREYRQFSCGRSGQDAYGWLIIYYGGDGRPYDAACTAGNDCPRIVAAFNPMMNNRTRFCGNHNFQVLPHGVSTNPMLNINWHGLSTSDHTVGIATWSATLAGNYTAGSGTMVVTGPPASTAAGGDTFPMGNWQVGDILLHPHAGAQETFKITSVTGTGPVTLGVTQIFGTAISITAGDSLYADCSALNTSGLGNGGWMLTYWKFLLDPHGTDTTSTNLVFDRYWDSGGHYDNGILGRLTEGWPTQPGDIEARLDTPVALNVTDTPPFHGVVSPCYSSTCVKHPSYHQLTTYTPAGVDREWFTDQMTWNGGEEFFGPNNGRTITNITGNLYRYNGASNAPWSNAYGPVAGKDALYRKILPTIAITGGFPYTDISGPGSVITGGTGDGWKYCVAYLAGECVSGSNAGDVYFNAGTTIDLPYCSSADGAVPQRHDICIGAGPAYSNSIPQLLISATDTVNATRRSRVVTHALLGPRQSVAFPSAKALPDASWMLFVAGYFCNADEPQYFCNQWMVKVPPFPAQDAYDRSDFIPTTVNVSSVPDGTSNVIVRFGYLENGTADQLYCTSRRETCVANATNIPAGLDPFRFPVEGTGGVESGLAGVSCITSCTVNLPTITGRTVYFRVIFRDAANATISTGPLQAAIVP